MFHKKILLRIFLIRYIFDKLAITVAHRRRLSESQRPGDRCAADLRCVGGVDREGRGHAPSGCEALRNTANVTNPPPPQPPAGKKAPALGDGTDGVCTSIDFSRGTHPLTFPEKIPGSKNLLENGVRRETSCVCVCPNDLCMGNYSTMNR